MGGAIVWAAILLAIGVAIGTAFFSSCSVQRGAAATADLARANVVLGLSCAFWITLDWWDTLLESGNSFIEYLNFTAMAGAGSALLLAALVYRGTLRRVRGRTLLVTASPSLLLTAVTFSPYRISFFEDGPDDLSTTAAVVALLVMFSWFASAVLLWTPASGPRRGAADRLPALTAGLFAVSSFVVIVVNAADPFGAYGILMPLIPASILLASRGASPHVPPPALRTLVDTLPDAVVALDAGGRPAYLNHRALALASLPAVPTERELHESIVSGWIEAPTGTTVFVQGVVLSLRRVAVPDQGDVVVLRDMSEAYAAAETAENAAAERGEFLAVVSHELRTPLGGILGLAELLHESSLTGEQRGWVHSVESCARRLTALVSDVLDLSKIDARRFELSPAPTDVAALLRDAAGVHGNVARAKGVRVRVVGGDEPIWRLCDALRVRQIADNLIGNAVKFTARGEIVVTLRAERTVVEVEVADNGPGVPDDRREAIFEPYRQADASTAQHHGGTGLGLPIARRLARQMGGDVTVEPSEQAGSIFRALLRVAECEAPEAARPNAETTVLAGARVLLVEDEPVLAMVGTAMLTNAGAVVVHAANGEEAVGECRVGEFHLILMDMRLPGLSGPEAARKIREEGFQGPIAALTANAQPSDRDLCRAAGMDAFLTKPITREALLREVGGLIGERAPATLMA